MTSTLLQQAVEALTRASSGLSYYRTVKHDDSFLVGVAADLHSAKSLIEQNEQESTLQQQPEPVALSICYYCNKTVAGVCGSDYEAEACTVAQAPAFTFTAAAFHDLCRRLKQDALQQQEEPREVAHIHESCWLIEATAPPRPLYYAGPKRGGRHNRTLSEVTEDASRAIRFPTEDAAKLTIALICGVYTDDATWPLRLINSGWKATEHIFDYTPLAASPSPQDFTLPMLEEGKGADGVALPDGGQNHGA